ncbi:MAG: iron-containing alcohol dehydrogenase, partial [Roseiflexus sp.]|nr:iron-containing alcohol dehydrogenase [Roseiflexus sp.]
IIEMPLHEIVEQRRVAQIASGAALAAAVHAGLRLPAVWSAEPREASEAHFEDLARAAPAETEVIYGIGGGLAADAAKYVARRRGLPLMLIPTALSVDAHFTWVSGVRRDGCVAYLATGPAAVVYADVAFLAAAPPHLRAAGVCDLLSIATALHDWRYAEERGMNPPDQRYTPWVAAAARAILDGTLDIADAAGRGDPAGVRELLRLLALEVQLCNLTGHSRPEEGSEHYLAYALEAHPSIGSGHAHGDLVGPAILRAAAWQGQDVAPLERALAQAGVPLDRVPETVMQEVIRELPAYVWRHRLAFSTAHDLYGGSHDA